eukprot:1086687-Pelagomonas_calceolata.AAC.3
MRDYLTLVTSESTGQPYDRVIRELSRNKWMDPKQAIEYGMIDKVATVHRTACQPQVAGQQLSLPLPAFVEQ